jgi:LL-H family phage holin
MEDLLMQVLWDLLVLLITILAGVFIKFLTKKLGIEQMKLAQSKWESMKDLASVAVKYAEQAYINYGGTAKKEKALAFLSRELSGLGINVSTDTLNDLLEAALREIKDTLGEDWADALKTANETQSE